MTIRIKVKNLPPAPEPTRAYRPPDPEPHGYDFGIQLKRRDYDKVQDGMYGVSAEADENGNLPKNKAVKARYKTPLKDLPYDVNEFSDYLSKHTRRETADHYGITPEQVDNRRKALKRRGLPATCVKSEVKGAAAKRC